MIESAFSGLLAQATTLPVDPTGTLPQRAQSAVGFLLLLGLTFLIGRIKNGSAFRVPWRALTWGCGLMVAFAIVALKSPDLLFYVNQLISALLGFAKEGAHLVFGELCTGKLTVTAPDGHVVGLAADAGYFAFFVAPTIIFFCCLTAVCYHTGAMQYVVQGIAWVMSKSMRTSGAETLCAATNIFVGQTEAPLMIKPFLAAATNSELMAVMVVGFANIASGVLGLYSFWLGPFVRDAGGHLAASCFISCPASLFISKLLVPETTVPQTAGGVQFEVKRLDHNLIDALTRGTSEGLALTLNVGAMLIAFTAFVALLNGALAWASAKVGLMPGGHPVTLEWMLGVLFAPLAWAVGIPWRECPTVGSLLGVKTVLNELIAYSHMKDLLTDNPGALSPRSALLSTYALCGFANFASIGIQVGGITTMIPNRRKDLAELGLLAMVGGGLATLLAAAVVGVIK
jgi:CNT family concentrative nucleoside transporter